MSTRDRVVVVTGGSAGVGRATVLEFAVAGYRVGVVARGSAVLDAAVADVERAGSQGLAVPTDVADDGAVEAAVDRVEQEFGPISVWVNAAFCGSLAFAWDTSAEEFRRMTEVTYFGQVYGTQAALRRMRPRNCGVIINVGSAMAFRSIPLQSAYCGAKHAVKGFTESVITELAHERSKVSLCMVQLPGLNTPQFSWNLNRMPKPPMPVPPIYQPELPARAIRFLAEHPRRNMWIGLSAAYTILGERLAPKLLDLYLARRGVQSQQTNQQTRRLGPNLYTRSDDTQDLGAHGCFDDQAHGRDPLLWTSMHRGALLSATAGAGIATAGTVAGLLARRR